MVDRKDAMGVSLRVDVPTPWDMRGFGRFLADQLRPGDVVILTGELGAGKTQLTKGIAEGLGVMGSVISPTFVLSRIHRSAGDGPMLVHVDAYRLNGPHELDDLDIDMLVPQAVTVIEWGEGVAEGLSDSRLDVTIERSADPDDDVRVVNVVGVGPRWELVQWPRSGAEALARGAGTCGSESRQPVRGSRLGEAS